MDVKIAIASSDGLTVNEHFGRAHCFRIYRLNDAGYEFVELRENIPIFFRSSAGSCDESYRTVS